MYRYAVLILLVFGCACQALSTPASAAGSTTTTTSVSSSSGQVNIDKQQFELSVPSYALLGKNYTLDIVVQNDANLTVPAMVEVSSSVDAIFVHPRVVSVDIPPHGSSSITNFTMVAFAPPHQGGPFNVTAQLYVFFRYNMSTPQLADQATAYVSTIGPNPFPYLMVVLVAASAVILAPAVVLVLRRRVLHSSRDGGDGR